MGIVQQMLAQCLICIGGYLICNACDQGYLYIKISIFYFFPIFFVFWSGLYHPKPWGPLLHSYSIKKTPWQVSVQVCWLTIFRWLKQKWLDSKIFSSLEINQKLQKYFFMIMFFGNSCLIEPWGSSHLGQEHKGPPSLQ
jgi:hypothetical protein